MPCRSYEDDWGRDNSAANAVLLANNDKLARIACNALNAIENGIPLTDLLKDKEVATWWKAHKAADAKDRKAKEKEKQKADAIRKAREDALAKLTPEELSALGLAKVKGSKNARA